MCELLTGVQTGALPIGGWVRTRTEDRYGFAVAEDCMSVAGVSLSAGHGSATARKRWGGGEFRLTGLSSRIDAGYDGWSLALARSGPVPLGRIDVYEMEIGFPAQDAMIYPETSGVRTRWKSGMIAGMATWMDWSVFDTDFGFQDRKSFV